MQYLSVCTCRSSPAIRGPVRVATGQGQPGGHPIIVLCLDGWPCCLSSPCFSFSHFLLFLKFRFPLPELSGRWDGSSEKGVSRRGGPKGWLLPPQAHLGPHRRLLRGLTRGTMSTYLPAAPWTSELSPEQGGTLQEGPSFHQPPYAHPMFSSQKTPQQAPSSRASPDPASATGGSALESCPLAGAPTAVCVSFHASDLCFFFPTLTLFARALLEPCCPSADCAPQHPLPAPRCVTLPCRHHCWVLRAIPSQPVILGPFVPISWKRYRPLTAGRIRPKY